MSYRRPLVLALATLAVAGSAALFLSGVLTSRAVQDPTISIDMVTTGNTYTDGPFPFPNGNIMNLGPINPCLEAATGNNNLHIHTAHVVIQNVEDLVGWKVRLNYIGNQMRPNTVSFTPFADANTGQNISFLNLPIDALTGVHRDIISSSAIPPSAPGPQTAAMGASYLAAPNFAVSPDTPYKTIGDESVQSYDAPTGGVLASFTAQVLAGNLGQASLFLNMDDSTPNGPGSGVAIFDGTGSVDQLLPVTSLGDGYHDEITGTGAGQTCTPLDCVTPECPPITPSPTPTPAPDSDGDGVPDGSDNCPNWPNPAQNPPPWPVPANDPDCDGFSTAVENSAGTNPLAHCGTDAWPADINNDTFVGIVADISALAGQFGQTVPPAPARYDIGPDPPDGFIDVIGDISRMTALYALSCA